MVDCYIGLGGNLAGTLAVMRQAVADLGKLAGIEGLSVSKLYQTTPVSNLVQPLYLNAVCRFQTTLPLGELWKEVQDLEKRLGKIEKPKNSPRLIDLDLLFYGEQREASAELTLPHPRWSERLFVLIPLADVTEKTPDGTPIKRYLESFSNPHQEQVTELEERLVSDAENSC